MNRTTSHAESFGDLFHRQTDEETELDNTGVARVEIFELAKSLFEIEDVDEEVIGGGDE